MSIVDFQDMQKKFLFNRPRAMVFRFPLSYTHIAYIIYHIRQCGLISHLEEKEVRDITGDIYSRSYDRISDLLMLFPHTVAIVDRHLTAGKKAYLDFLMDLNLISHGVLCFTDISDGIPDHFTLETDSTFMVSFTCNGKRHEVECTLIGNEFHARIVYYVINEIIRKEYPNYQLIQLISQNYTHDKYIFATNQQSDYLESMKLRDAIDRF